MIEEFVSILGDRRPPAVSGADGYAATAVALAAYESVATGGPVRPEPL
jgi:predicted dehydrogenase